MIYRSDRQLWRFEIRHNLLHDLGVLLNVEVLTRLGQPDELSLREECPDGLFVGLPDVLRLLAADEQDGALVLGVGGEEQVRVVRHQVWNQNFRILKETSFRFQTSWERHFGKADF